MTRDEESEALRRLKTILSRRNVRFTIGDTEYVMTTNEAAAIRNRISDALTKALEEPVQPESADK